MVGDHLEHPVAEHQVGVVLHQPGQPGQVTLDAGDQVGDAALGSPAPQGGEGVGTGIDDGDPVSQAGQPDGEPAGAAADVEDPHGGGVLGCLVEDPLDGRPDDGRAGGAAALAG